MLLRKMTKTGNFHHWGQKAIESKCKNPGPGYGARAAAFTFPEKG
jgi:hypothetical protein